MSAENPEPSLKELHELIALQTSALKRLEEHFAPESLEEIEERRFERLKALAVRTASMAALAVSGVLGAWEFGMFIKESWEVRATAANYADVGVRLYYDENNITVAKEFVEKALELSPDNAEFLYLDAYIDGMSEVRRLFNLDRPYTAEELDAAYRAVAKSILLEQQEPDKPEAYILRGQIYAALKERERAIVALERAIALAPSNDFAVMRLGVVEYGAGQTDKALGLFDEALALNPKSKWAHLWKGIVFSDTKKLTEAREALSRALEIDPRFDLALYNLGWIDLKEKKKNYAGAEELFRKALSVNPSYKEALYGLGMVYGYQNQYEIAHGYLSKALDLDPGFLTAWKWRGIVSYEMKNFEDAVSDFSEGLALDPSNADLFVRRARVSVLTENYTDALDDLLLAKKFNPKNPRTFLYLGQVYQSLEQVDPALEALRQALTLNPKYADAHALVAKIQTDQGLPEDAIKSYQEAINSTRYRQERFVVPLAGLLVAQGRSGEAYEELNRLASEGSKAPDVWFELFNVSVRTGNLTRAKDALAEFVRLAPASDKIETMRSKL